MSLEESQKNIVDALSQNLGNLKLKAETNSETSSLSAKSLLDIISDATNKPQVNDGNHVFWNTQPVLRFSEDVSSDEIGPIDATSSVSKIPTRPYLLPDAFEWVDIDINDETHLTQLYTLLNENYVEDGECMFRFDYKPAFLQWAMTPPGYKKNWHVGVRVRSSKRLVGFISGVAANIKVLGTSLKAAEINFLCVHKQLRSKRLAPVLIKEVTRRINLCDIWQAVYTAGVLIPRPVATCRYWHRPLDIRKLVTAQFSTIGNRMTISRAQRLYKLPVINDDFSMRPMEPRDIEGVTKLLNSYLTSYKIHQVFTDEEVNHAFLPKKDIVYTYVKCSEEGMVTDILSFYCLESSVINNPRVSHIRAAYSYYNVATTVSFKNLMQKALHFAHEHSFDVFNALDLMENSSILEDLKFGEGDGGLHYYIYNWRVTNVSFQYYDISFL
uniref:Glycylpeptide N-tetradecanoyltransferase n=1 Tax=Babesia bovis TaxID=5865 RepID=A7AQ05_BABBO|eukprot:XP_001612207.1 myristoyl-CoA:protein N-myristoyltransferase, N-terminal domain containing protein [Babesia bovis T2Bo]